ncbi:phytanoyl-CoA dioxygenase family protein [uncultured Sphingomonas sp.]|uniref:phytanoyl-CoA dioxygenase family protein n=1 Tax=uncultured Sphingomonas sp. TaxID=158754 RepID=UPI0025D041C7|nr:phytanoyl-CoA dioxygenase family protein [uncultured Sphingomonas sp.]
MTVLRYIKAPWWVFELATGAKSFRDNPLIGSRRLNRWGLHAARVAVADRMAWNRRARLRRLIGAEDAAAFARDGFVRVPDFLAAEAFVALRDQVMARRAPAREMVQGDTVTRRMALDPAALKAMPAAAALMADRRFQGLIRYVGSYDAAPTCYIQTILSHRHAAPPDPQTNLHVDTFHPTVKAWLFLTDVAEDEGPLTYVPGSHRRDAARMAWERQRSLEVMDGDDFLAQRGSLRIRREELAGLGLPDPVAFAVRANTLVVADTGGFHARGPSVRPSTRVEIWAYGRRNPYLPWTGLDLGGLPGLSERRVPLYWALRDRFRRFVGQPWMDVGPKRPADE